MFNGRCILPVKERVVLQNFSGLKVLPSLMVPGGNGFFIKALPRPDALLQIDWTKTATGVGYVKYTYVKTGDFFKTSYIEYGLNSSALNAHYNVRITTIM